MTRSKVGFLHPHSSITKTIPKQAFIRRTSVGAVGARPLWAKTFPKHVPKFEPPLHPTTTFFADTSQNLLPSAHITKPTSQAGRLVQNLH
jgi:hypothetical protein